jgi:glycerate 2-kinase
VNILICPDSLKGSLSAREFCDISKKIFLDFSSSYKIATRPLADGGENTLEAILPYLPDAEIKWVDTYDPLMRPIKAPYILKGRVAYVEMAKASGLTLIDEEDRNVLHSSSYGTGVLIKDAIEHNANEINLFVGGSATNDGGVGLANALGLEFYTEDGILAQPNPASILDVTDIECTQRYSDVVFNLITDVRNPLCGENGASVIYGPQKGASPDDVDFLDKSLLHLADLIEKISSRQVHDLRGIGAAGGVGACLAGFYNTHIYKGTDIIFQLLSIPNKVKAADLVITGEGKYDSQSSQGKLVNAVLDLCHKYNKPSIVIAGIIEDTIVPYNAMFLQLKKEGMTLEKSITETRNSLAEKIQEIIVKYPPKEKLDKKK